MDRDGVISNKNLPLTDPPMLSNETNYIPLQLLKQENGNPSFGDHLYDTVKTIPWNSPSPYATTGAQSTTSNTNALTAEEQKRRSRQTIGVVFFGILLIGAAAAATALIIHYVFITGLYIFFNPNACLKSSLINLQFNLKKRLQNNI